MWIKHDTLSSIIPFIIQFLCYGIHCVESSQRNDSALDGNYGTCASCGKADSVSICI